MVVVIWFCGWEKKREIEVLKGSETHNANHRSENEFVMVIHLCEMDGFFDNSLTSLWRLQLWMKIEIRDFWGFVLGRARSKVLWILFYYHLKKVSWISQVIYIFFTGAAPYKIELTVFFTKVIWIKYNFGFLSLFLF